MIAMFEYDDYYYNLLQEDREKEAETCNDCFNDCFEDTYTDSDHYIKTVGFNFYSR